MDQNTLTITLTGTRPLLVHNARLSDPLDEIVREMKTLTGKRKKTDEDHEELARLEFIGGLYFNDIDGPFIPSDNIQRCLVDGGRLSKEGKNVERGLQVETMENPILYKGARTTAEMWQDKNFIFRKSVKVGMSRVIRTRPIFREWELDFTVRFDSSVIEKHDVLRLATTAGAYVGLGDWRPNYGRFTAKESV